MAPESGSVRTYRVACIGAARMASWSDDLMRQRAGEGDPWALEWIPGAIATVCRVMDRLELVAVCDLDAGLAEQTRSRWSLPASYTDWREMLAREQPDIVAIVTSYGSTHAELAAGVAETGIVKGIYCEKPIATSMVEASRIVDACRTHGVALTVAHVFRWNARYRQAQAWIQEGAIGDVRAITCSAMGTLLHSGTHQADAMLGLAGDAELAWASGAVDAGIEIYALPQRDWPVFDPAGGGIVELRNGVHLMMEARSPGPRVIQASGTQGRICLWNDLHQVQLWQKDTTARRSELLPGSLLSPPQESSYTVTQFSELIDVLDRGGFSGGSSNSPGGLSCDAVRASRALELVLGLHQSHRAGGARIAFPLTDRTFAVDTK